MNIETTLDIYLTYRAFFEWLGNNAIITKIGMLAILTHFKEIIKVNVTCFASQYA
jgi:hypothetical protein